MIAMHPKRAGRLLRIILLLCGLAGALFFTLRAFQSNITYFFSPSEIAAGNAPVEYRIRVGGMVVPGSFLRDETTLRATFDVTDNVATLRVAHMGVLPDLFREGQGVVAEGRLHADGTFTATTVLAKHDENYMPPEVAAALQATRTINTNTE